MRGPRAGSRRGLALVVVLWVLVIMNIVCLSFAHLTRVEAQLADNFYQRSRALYMAEAGVQRLLVELENDVSGYTWPGQAWAMMDSQNEDLPFEEERYELETTDECGKLNINTADREMLLRMPGMTEEIADSILDWRDSDDSPREQGAETEYYRSQQPSYDCPNRPFVTTEELLLVRGMTPDLLYGVAGQGDEAEQAGLAHLLTIYSVTKDIDELGQPRLNINTASQQQMEEQLADALAEGDAAAIVRFRNSRGNFETPAHVWDVPEIDREKMKKLLGRITTRGTPEESEPTGPEQSEEGGEGDGEGALPGGNIPMPPGGGQPQFGPGGGRGTRQAPGQPGLPGGMPGGLPGGGAGGGVPGMPGGLTPEGPGDEEAPPEEPGAQQPSEPELIRGAININTAPAEVLLCLPQMDEATAQEIATRAQTQPFEKLGDILEVEQIEPPLLKAIVEQITTRSLALRTVARGTLEQRRVAADITAVVDLTQDDPRLVYYRRGDTTANQYRPAGVSRSEY